MNPIVKEAYTWLGTPHVNQAKVKGKGIDCGMLLIACLEGAGYIKRGAIKIPRIPMSGICTTARNGSSKW